MIQPQEKKLLIKLPINFMDLSLSRSTALALTKIAIKATILSFFPNRTVKLNNEHGQCKTPLGWTGGAW